MRVILLRFAGAAYRGLRQQATRARALPGVTTAAKCESTSPTGSPTARGGDRRGNASPRKHGDRHGKCSPPITRMSANNGHSNKEAREPGTNETGAALRSW